MIPSANFNLNRGFNFQFHGKTHVIFLNSISRAGPSFENPNTIKRKNRNFSKIPDPEKKALALLHFLKLYNFTEKIVVYVIHTKNGIKNLLLC